MKTASWVIVRLDTGEAVLETYSAANAAKINTDKYKAVPIAEYLASLSSKEPS